jgi:hypothetical protein
MRVDLERRGRRGGDLGQRDMLLLTLVVELSGRVSETLRREVEESERGCGISCRREQDLRCQESAPRRVFFHPSFVMKPV